MTSPVSQVLRGGGEAAVIGLGRSGRAVTRLLRAHHVPVYASDAGAAGELEATARDLRGLGAAVDVGTHDLGRIAQAAVVVVSPGVPPQAAPLATARAAGVPVVGELEVALEALPSLRYVAITGTNGKTTTTALVGHLLRALGHDAIDAGNIGTPLAEYALRTPPPSWAALETSSFQLHDLPGINPTVGVVTNLSPDHLDRYASLDEYYGDKALLFRNAHRASRWVLNGDDPEVMELHRRLPGRGATMLQGHVFTVSMRSRGADAWFDREAGMLHLLGEPLLPRRDLPLLGDHNVANALTAVLSVAVADAAHRTAAARAAMAEALRSMRALPHRLEPVPTTDGILWLNDSKATNVSSTLVAVQGMRQPFVLLLGGRHKGEPYTALAAPFAAHGLAVLAYGEAREQIVADLAGLVPVERIDGPFTEVVARARALASTVTQGAVLLSPACSSYDMFTNYEQRGETFRRLARGATA